MSYDWSYIRSELNPIDLFALEDKVLIAYNSFLVEYNYDGEEILRSDIKKDYNINEVLGFEIDLFDNIWLFSGNGNITVLDEDYNFIRSFTYLEIDEIESCINIQKNNEIFFLCSSAIDSQLGLLSFTYNSNGAPEYQDFYSMSMFRDLLFHVQEHRFTIPQIKNRLLQLGLTFGGFEDARIIKNFKTTYPVLNAVIDLDKWHEFEKEYPDTFVGMYQFWCHKN